MLLVLVLIVKNKHRFCCIYSNSDLNLKLVLRVALETLTSVTVLVTPFGCVWHVKKQKKNKHASETWGYTWVTDLGRGIFGRRKRKVCHGNVIWRFILPHTEVLIHPLNKHNNTSKKKKRDLTATCA